VIAAQFTDVTQLAGFVADLGEEGGDALRTVNLEANESRI
jgi:hypothetical protein